MSEEKGKKYTLASKLALVGGFLILLNPYFGIYFWIGRPGTGYGLAPFFWLIATFWLVCGIAIMVCAVMLKLKPGHKVAFGAMIILCSLLSPFYFLLLPYPHLSALWYGLINPALSLGVVLGVVGGLCAIYEGKAMRMHALERMVFL